MLLVTSFSCLCSEPVAVVVIVVVFVVGLAPVPSAHHDSHSYHTFTRKELVPRCICSVVYV